MAETGRSARGHQDTGNCGLVHLVADDAQEIGAAFLKPPRDVMRVDPPPRKLDRKLDGCLAAVVNQRGRRGHTGLVRIARSFRGQPSDGGSKVDPPLPAAILLEGNPAGEIPGRGRIGPREPHARLGRPLTRRRGSPPRGCRRGRRQWQRRVGSVRGGPPAYVRTWGPARAVRDRARARRQGSLPPGRSVR